MDPVSAVLLTFGLALLVASWGLLLVSSFREDFTWGLCTVFLPPLAYFYGLFNWSKAGDSIIVGVIGLFLIILM